MNERRNKEGEGMSKVLSKVSVMVWLGVKRIGRERRKQKGFIVLLDLK